jgi:hypothetical protein
VAFATDDRNCPVDGNLAFHTCSTLVGEKPSQHHAAHRIAQVPDRSNGQYLALPPMQATKYTAPLATEKDLQ